MTVFSIALMLFFMANPIGAAPAVVALLKDFDPKQQKTILLREGIFSLIAALFYLYLGEFFLSLLHIQPYSVGLSGGVLVFLVALTMIFPHPQATSSNKITQEPFIVPIAVPLIAGGGVFTLIVTLYKQVQSFTIMTEAILLTWTVIIAVLYCSSIFQKLLGKSGLVVLEQLMGMLLMMISIEIFLGGLTKLIHTMHATI